MSRSARRDRGDDLAPHLGDHEHDTDERGHHRDRGEADAAARVVGVQRRRGERRGHEEQDHLDRTADAGAQHHRAPARRDGDALLVQVVELERGATDAVRGDEVQEGARELHQHGGDEGQIRVDAAHEGGAPGHRHEGVEDEREHRPAPGGVLELLLHGVPVDALEARDRDREGEQHPGEHPDVHQAEPLHLERRDVFDSRRGRRIGAELLQRLAEVLLARGRSPSGARPAGPAGSTPRAVRAPPPRPPRRTARSLPTISAVVVRSAATSRLRQ